LKPAAVPGCRPASHQAAQQEQEEQEQQEQSPLDRTAALLATDLTHAFLKVRKPMDALELYHKEIVLEDRIRGKTFNGIVLYLKNLHLLKIVANIKFVYCRPKLNITKLPDSNSIRVDWRMVGLTASRVCIRFFPDKLWNRNNMDAAAVVWHEGQSTFQLDQTGKIIRHVVDKPRQQNQSETVGEMRRKISKMKI